MFPRKPGNVALERHGTHRRPEIEESHLSDAEPVGEVSGVGEGRRQADDPYALVGVRWYEVGSRNNHFEYLKMSNVKKTLEDIDIKFIFFFKGNSIKKAFKTS